MSQLISTANLARVGLDKIVKQYMDNVKSYWPMLVGQTPSTTQKFYRVEGFSGFNVAGVLAEGDVPTSQSLTTPFEVDVYPVMRALAFTVTRQADFTDQYGLIKSATSKGGPMAAAIAETDEYEMASAFQSMFTAPTSGGLPTLDNVAHCGTTHPIETGTASNLSTTLTLSMANLQTALQNAATTKTYRGNPWAYMGAYNLVVPAALEMLALRLTSSAQLAQVADNDINPVKSRMSTIMYPWLTSTTDYWLVAADKSKNGIDRLTRIPLTSEVFPLPNLAFRYTMFREAVIYGRDWRGTYGVNL
jgi:hypothetical protein